MESSSWRSLLNGDDSTEEEPVGSTSVNCLLNGDGSTEEPVGSTYERGDGSNLELV